MYNVDECAVRISQLVSKNGHKDGAIVIGIAGISGCGRHVLARRIKMLLRTHALVEQGKRTLVTLSLETESINAPRLNWSPQDIVILVHRFISLLADIHLDLKVVVDGGLWPDFVTHVFSNKTRHRGQRERDALAQIRSELFPSYRNICMQQPADMFVWNEYDPFEPMRSPTYTAKLLCRDRELSKHVLSIMDDNDQSDKDSCRVMYHLDTYLVPTYSDKQHPLLSNIIRMRQSSRTSSRVNRLDPLRVTYGPVARQLEHIVCSRSKQRQQIPIIVSPDRSFITDIKTMYTLLALGYELQETMLLKKTLLTSQHWPADLTPERSYVAAYLVECGELGSSHICFKSNDRESLLRFLQSSPVQELLNRLPSAQWSHTPNIELRLKARDTRSKL